MTRSQLALRVAELNPHLTLAQVEAVVRTIFGTMTDALTRGDRVELRDFGSFAVTQLEARPGRNPRTGVHVDVSARSSIRFKAGKAMRERVRVATGPAVEAPDQDL